MKRPVKPLAYRIFVGDRPWEEMSKQEKEEYGTRAAERMGRALNDYFSCHIDEYQKVEEVSG